MTKDEVIKYFGSIREVAKALGITTQAVYSWKLIIPEGAAFKLMHLTDRGLTVNQALYAVPQ